MFARFKLSGAFLALLLATFCLWQFRFARSPQDPTLTLADLKASASLGEGATWIATANQPALRLRPTTPSNPVMEHIPLPGLPASHWLHLKFHLSAENLRLGPQPWSDGRLILEWRTDTIREFDAICSVRDNQDSKIVEVIARPNQGSATPSLHLENLGHSGDFNIHLLEATVVEERALWRIGKWALLTAWAAWFAVAAGFTKTHLRPWPWVAGGVWLLMALNCSFPGPWKTLRPLTAPFRLGPEVQRPLTPKPSNNPPVAQAPTTNVQPSSPTTVLPPAPPPLNLGRIPSQDSPLVKLKDAIYRRSPALKPLFHSPLLFVPTLLSLFLISPRRTFLLAGLSAIAIEATQLAFGYSLDWLDALDLLCDAIGILLAWLTWRRLTRARREAERGEVIS